MKILRSLEKILLTVVVLAALFYGYKKIYPTFPELTGAKAVTYNWEYQHKPYSLTMTLHQSVYEYYRGSLKGIFIGREAASINRYLSPPKEDPSISKLTAELVRLGQENGLNRDQTVELAVAFVQSIPYDTEKAQADPTHPNYAYEVLYDYRGICTDKSFLMDEILRNMGYGCAIFFFPKDQHMAVGIQAPREYSTDNTGYCMIETTNTHIKIGVVPGLDANSKRALERQAVAEFNLRNPNTTAGKKLSSPDVISETTGLEYRGIINTINDERTIADLQVYFREQRPVIEGAQSEIRSLENRMESLKASGRISEYNALVEPHNEMVDKVGALIKEYNAKVAEYNALVKES